MNIRQFKLFDANDNSVLTCWLDDDARVKVGARVTLKGMPRRDWIVVARYQTVKEDAELNRRWKVGGLL